MTTELRNKKYNPIEWEDRVLDSETGDILVYGTPVNEVNLNRMETGILTGHYDVGLAALMALQLINTTTLELTKIKNQRLLQGRDTIVNTQSDNGYFRSADPFVLVPLKGFEQINAPNYDVVLTAIDDNGSAGNLIAYDKTRNGFKVKFTGSAKSASFIWTLVNLNV